MCGTAKLELSIALARQFRLLPSFPQQPGVFKIVAALCACVPE